MKSKVVGHKCTVRCHNYTTKIVTTILLTNEFNKVEPSELHSTEDDMFNNKHDQNDTPACDVVRLPHVMHIGRTLQSPLPLHKSLI